MTAHVPEPPPAAAIAPSIARQAELLSVASRGARGQLPWFFAWVAVGVGAALAVTALGVFAVPLALLGAALLIGFHHVGRPTFGMITGMGLLFLYVAYVQRRGPGTVYWHTATSSGSDQYLDPRPWLAAGILLVALGLGAFLWRRRGAGGDGCGAQRP